MNAATSRSASRHLCLNFRHLFKLSSLSSSPSSRRASTVTYTPPPSASSVAKQQQRQQQRRESPPKPRPFDQPQAKPRQRSTIVPDTIAPSLSLPELASVYSQELYVFRCDVTATHIPEAMASYRVLAEIGVLTDNDLSNLARQIHARYRMDEVKADVLPHIETLVADFEARKVPGHPLASVHLLSCLKDMQEFPIAARFWAWLVQQDEQYCDARTYGAAIECLSYQGVDLAGLEGLWEDALGRYSTTTVPSVAIATGRGVPVMLLQGIITARLLNGNWRAAYEALDICIRLYPTLTPSRIYELFIYERPAREAYIIFLMACRAGTPPKPGVLTPLLKEVWIKTRDVRAMIRLVYCFVGAGGKPNAIHLNSLTGAILSTLPPGKRKGDPEYDLLFADTLKVVRSLINAFHRIGVSLSPASFNTIISMGGKLQSEDLVHRGFKELLAAGLQPTIITYRSLVNAVGDMKDASLLEHSWGMLKQGRKQLGEPWHVNDWRSLIKACVATGHQAYVIAELEKHKLELGNYLVNGVQSNLRRATTAAADAAATAAAAAASAPSPDTEERPRASPPTKEELEKDVRSLTEIFASNQIHDFSQRPQDGEALFDISPSDGVPRGVVLTPEQEVELESCYKQLVLGNGAGKYLEDHDQSVGNRSITGFSFERLRWENWKAVNRLLFEAEWAEREEEDRKVQATIDASGDSAVLESPGGGQGRGGRPKKEKNIGYEVTFWSEEKAKERIRREVERVVEGRMNGNPDWRKDEMDVRMKLANRVVA